MLTFLGFIGSPQESPLQSVVAMPLTSFLLVFHCSLPFSSRLQWLDHYLLMGAPGSSLQGFPTVPHLAHLPAPPPLQGSRVRFPGKDDKAMSYSDGRLWMWSSGQVEGRDCVGDKHVLSPCCGPSDLSLSQLHKVNSLRMNSYLPGRTTALSKLQPDPPWPKSSGEISNQLKASHVCLAVLSRWIYVWQPQKPSQRTYWRSVCLVLSLHCKTEARLTGEAPFQTMWPIQLMPFLFFFF